MKRTGMLWRGLDGHLLDHVGQARCSVLIVAPFIKEQPFRLLLNRVSKEARVEVFTRWLPGDVAQGVSDPQILRLAEARGATVNLVDELHAKLFLVDNQTALIGSANLTSAALGLSRKSNLELLVSIAPAPIELILFLSELRRRSRPASEQEMINVEAEAKRLLAIWVPTVTEPIAVSEESRVWLPRFRSPDRLYAHYQRPDELFSAPPNSPLIHDLLHLAPTAGHDEVAFNRYVSHALKSNPLVQRLDEFLSEPRRFGAITSWLSTQLGETDRRTAQAAAQVLIRWLTYFDPESYWVETPNYSEILYRKTDR